MYYLYSTLQKLRVEFPDNDITCDDFQSFFWALFPDAKADLYEGLFKDLRKASIDPAVGQGILNTIKQRQGLLKLSEKAYAASQGRGSVSDLVDIVAACTVEGTSSLVAEDAFVTTDLEVLVNNVVRTPGIRFRLNCLNKALGSLRKGDFGFIFARPETGKTTFLADVAAHAFDQVTSPVTWFNNEEQSEKVMLRVYQSYFGVTLTELLGNTKKYKELFNDKVGGKFRMVDCVSHDRTSIERIIDKTNPSLIIADTIDKFKGFDNERDDLRLGSLYQWGRELAKKYAPFIAVCQADGSGEGQKWLTMNNVSLAKTSKQAEADFIIGIGRTHDEASEYIRYLNLSKNKLYGDADSMSELRHGRFEILIRPDIARYQDIVEYG